MDIVNDLTGFQRDLLYVIASLDDPHGLAIKEELEEYYETEVHHGRLYPNLDTLVEKGLVDKGEIDKRTNSYALTRRGRRELEARREWENQYVDL
ncbi:PadR family transcriptional regulator [Halarchaeum rubridurum]|uniref:PadR family transcriptional regulator n=1 Tax=Halarchaeum rubridurum TaxID=489911 RepID=A0A830G5E9_9EURY|nr:PadR family transcriptional regulator [Halarchaeum rubridurum]GGM75291.1 PadR family transcriptional regulator [Halarchaeum rubridurum]